MQSLPKRNRVRLSTDGLNGAWASRPTAHGLWGMAPKAPLMEVGARVSRPSLRTVQAVFPHGSPEHDRVLPRDCMAASAIGKEFRRRIKETPGGETGSHATRDGPRRTRECPDPVVCVCRAQGRALFPVPAPVAQPAICTGCSSAAAAVLPGNSGPARRW